MFLFKPPLDGRGVERLRGLGSRARWAPVKGMQFRCQRPETELNQKAPKTLKPYNGLGFRVYTP